MRKEFLEAIDHRLYIAEAEYANWLHALEAMLDQSCADNAAYSIMSPLSALDNCSYAPTTGTTSVTTTMASTLYDHIPLDPLTLRLPGSFPVDLSPAMPIATVVARYPCPGPTPSRNLLLLPWATLYWVVGSVFET
ncbi:hypothetical protein BASA83_009467 [Batrachochytrium salamandrivorans]|nr:hypothetical protein BASA83_009467 [Batrachochytrium salamandrivorans]